ncbi:MAG: dihydroorotase family protein [Candidatus Methanomethylophilaceae archaeon]|nr:dihydroorotase family protein [Candidatus Methanomethylophilaceae archaeon]MDY0224840.1 dihydroorotase family protein [Candidatus Methanomethylophilaceae archaeon]
MDIDLVLEGRTFINGELSYAEIGIKDGKIVTLGKMVRGGEERIDIGTSKIILPGFMDPHVHFRDPGMTQKEDFGTGTMAAVHGGVTCVLDMPNTKPPAVNVQSVLDKKSIIKKKAYTDYGLFAAVTPGCHVGLLAPMVAGFKLFMGSTTGQILLNDDDEIASVMKDINITGKRLSVHAEDDNMISGESESCCRDHLRNRPVEAEYSAIRRLAHYKGMKINICHNTNPESIRMASELGFTTEVTLHHMFFDVDRNTTAEYKVNPPIRDKATKDKLFQTFLDNKITMFGTDHAPHTLSEKSQDFDSAPGGIPGVETSMPIVMNMVRTNIIPMEQAVRMGAEAPASAFNVKKGKIAVGYDADLALFDMRSVSTIDVKKLHSKAGYSPYAGWEAVFPDTVIIRGQIQVQDGEFCGERIGEDICG